MKKPQGTWEWNTPLKVSLVVLLTHIFVSPSPGVSEPISWPYPDPTWTAMNEQPLPAQTPSSSPTYFLTLSSPTQSPTNTPALIAPVTAATGLTFEPTQIPVESTAAELSAFVEQPATPPAGTPSTMQISTFQCAAFAPAPLPSELEEEKITLSGLTFYWEHGRKVRRKGEVITVSDKAAMECGDDPSTIGFLKFKIGSQIGMFGRDDLSANDLLVVKAASAYCKSKKNAFKYARIVKPGDWYAATIEKCGGDLKGTSDVASWTIKVNVHCSKSVACGCTKQEYDSALASYTTGCAGLTVTSPNSSCIDSFIGEYTALMMCGGGNFEPEDEYQGSEP